MSDIERETENPLRLQAIARLKKQRDFRTHVLVYLLVNCALVTIWAVTTSGGFFWPMFPIIFWGIGVVMNGWEVYHDDELSEQRIEQEMEHLRQRR
jgi:fatty acid desaturase